MTVGYSGTPLAAKLGIKEGTVVALINPPDDLSLLLHPLPAGAEVVAKGPVDMAILFATRAEDLVSQFEKAMGRIPADGAIWTAWPKKASKVPTDITEDRLRDLFLPTGMVDNKVAAISEIWSGLRFVVRKENRRNWSGGARR
jgi:hypothetical protein